MTSSYIEKPAEDRFGVELTDVDLRRSVIEDRWSLMVDSVAELIHARETRTVVVTCPWNAQADGYKRERRAVAEETLAHVGVRELLADHLATFGRDELMCERDRMNA